MAPSTDENHLFLLIFLLLISPKSAKVVVIDF